MPLSRKTPPLSTTSARTATTSSGAAARDRYQLPSVFILAVGAHRPHKNHEVLVRALTSVPDHVGLVIVGYFDPSFHDPLPGLIAELGPQFAARGEDRTQRSSNVAASWAAASR